MTTPPSPTPTRTPDAQISSDNNESSGKPQVYDGPTMNLSIFLLWILPLCSIALYSRIFADLTPITIPVDPPKAPPPKSKKKKQQQRSSPTMAPSPSTGSLSFPTSWPTAYVATVKSIHKRRRRIPGFPGDIDNMLRNDEPYSPAKKETTKKSKSTSQPKKSTDSLDDPAKIQMQQKIASLRKDFEESHPNDIYRGINAAEAMRYYTMQYHEGGTYERETIQLYERLIDMGQQLRNKTIAQGERTNKSDMSVHQELILDYKDKSPDGLLCALYTALGKTLFLANLFERAVEAYQGCLSIHEHYFDALNARGSAYIVLGQYEAAGQDLLKVIHKDHSRIFVDAFTGLARVLEADEDVVPGGWDTLMEPTEELIPMLEYQHKDEASRKLASTSLARLHHVLFTYHEKKSKQYKEAFSHLEKAHAYKLSTLPPWNGEMEKLKVKQLKGIFQQGFWNMKTGSSTNVPIFIIGFVRSGSTLLERILDAHPDIVGTGEDSVFNGRLGEIRNAIVEASHDPIDGDIAGVTKTLAESVVEEMYRRWSIIDASTNETPSTDKPKRLADKMLTNYYNIGFIEMLYPNALILHVAREPMDSIFSAFKHDFPSGTLDYTSDLDGVTDLYTSYRDVMDHWDTVLPGRIVHVRYEDMVNDFEGTARAIINATGLPWDDGVLEFHKQKHAVNTFSSTQVRKGVYKSGMKFWKRYETELAPLVKKVGHRVKYNLKTSLPGYSPPKPSNNDGAHNSPSDEL